MYVGLYITKRWLLGAVGCIYSKPHVNFILIELLWYKYGQMF